MVPTIDRTASAHDICSVERLTDVKVIIAVNKNIDKGLIHRNLNCVRNIIKKILSIHLHANQNRFVNSDKNPILHVVRECPRLYYLSYIVRKGSPLLQSIDNIVRYAFEAGLCQEN